jgi:large subunit ribosomal protein L14e
MIEVGRVAVKIAGRDAGKKCVIIDIIDKTFVMIDGETRRRKCNINHLELVDEVIALDKNASHNEIIKVFKDMGTELRAKKSKQKTVKPKMTGRKVKEPVVEEKKPAKKVKKK